MKKTDFSKAAGGHSFSCILEASVPGRSSNTLIVVIPLNHDDQAPPDEDGSFGIACGLALLASFQENAPPLTVRMVFLGGEFESGGEHFLGTEQFLKTYFPEERSCLLYLNLKRVPSRITLRYGGRGTASPLWLLRAVINSLTASGVQYTVRGIDLPVYRAGLEIAKRPLGEYLRAGIPALTLETSGPPESGQPPGGRLRALVEGAIRFTDSFPSGLPEDWDRHYVLFTLPFFPPLLVSETAYLAVLLAFTFAILAFAAFRIPVLKKYAATLRRNFWNVPFFIAAAFLILLGSGYLLDALLAIRNFPDLWMSAPALFFLLKLGVFLSAAALLYRVGRRLPFAKKGTFYTAAALLFTVLCIVVVACLNVSFAYYFLWPLICIVIGSIVNRRALKVLFFGLSPLSVALLLAEVFSLSEPRLLSIFLFNKVFGNFLFTVIVLPYLLLLIRIRFLFPFRRGSLLSSRSFLFLILTLAGSVALAVVLLFYDPYARRPQPVLAEQIVDYDRRTRTLRLSSPAPLGEFQIVDTGGLHPVVRTNSRQYLISLADVKDYISATYSGTRFAARKNFDFVLRFLGSPYKVNAVISANADFKLYDSNFPVQKAGVSRYAISIGINPPQDLGLELTLPMDRDYRLELEVLYKTAAPDIGIHGDNFSLENRLTFRKTIAFTP
ncbi:MAG: hypothetical protein JXD23_15710 [Spirochaetales bacterium]|nr:hypothetical protein [Spirochaetales bacterium]